LRRERRLELSADGLDLRQLGHVSAYQQETRNRLLRTRRLFTGSIPGYAAAYESSPHGHHFDVCDRGHRRSRLPLEAGGRAAGNRVR
jgi:hypothetical protein